MPVVSYDGDEKGWGGVTFRGSQEELTSYIEGLDPSLECWIVGYGLRERSNGPLNPGDLDGWGYLTVLPAFYPDDIRDMQDDLTAGIDQFKKVKQYHIRTRYA